MVNKMELVDKKALTKHLMEMRNKIFANNDEYFLGQKTGLAKAIGVILAFPVAEPEHGHWVGCSFNICSLCKNMQEHETPYCSNCGAKMDI